MRFMQTVISFLLAVMMLIMNPFLNFVDANKPKPEGTFMEYTAAEKTDRAWYTAAPGDNDIILQPGDSLPGAIARVREKRAAGDPSPVVIFLREGTYAAEGTLSFAGLTDLTLAAWPGETVILTDGVSITGWRETTVNGVKAFAAQIPAGMSFHSLYRGSEPLRMTRYPESGYLTVKENDRANALFTAENTPWEYTYGDRSFYYGSDLGLTNLANVTDVRIKLMHYWFCESTSLTGIADGKIGILKPASMRIEAGDRYFLENVFEMLKNPGEWYLDTAASTVYYIPQAGDEAATLSLFAPVSTQLLDIADAQNLRFFNLRFSETDWSDPAPDVKVSWLGQYGMLHPQGNLECAGAVEIRDSSFIEFVNCDFFNIGNTGVRFSGRNTDCGITGCHFRNIGCNVVFIGGENAKEEDRQTRRIHVTDNLIESYGRVFPSGIGVLLTYAVDCDLSHNEVHDGYYSAFSVGWVWGYAFHATDRIRICDNLIYDIGQGWLSDMGGIYTLGQQPHTVISGNLIHHVAADPGEGGYGGWGVYLDEGSSNITVTKNLVYDCGSQSFHQHYGRDNMIVNNIFAFSGEGQIRSSRTEDHNEFTLRANLILSEDQPIWVNASEDRFMESGNLYWDYVNYSRVYAHRDAVPEQKTGRIYARALNLRGYLLASVIADPILRDPENRDFLVAENSPALTKIGFVPWDTSVAGTVSRF